MTNRLEVGKEPLKLEEDLMLLQNERCIVKAYRGTFVVPVYLKEETVGYVFHGEGKFLLDAVVETSKGALGKPIERKLENPFIMVCPTEKITEVKEKLVNAKNKELMQKGYKMAEEFIKASEELCFQMFRNARFCTFPKRRSYIFGFKREKPGKPDILISKGDELVYVYRKNAFVFKDGKSVMLKPGQVLIVENEKH